MGSKAKGSAPGQYLGYGLQSVRLFYHLLTCDSGARVGLEHTDDVSVHDSTGTLLAEQCKSALSRKPLTDLSVDLWKTFYNWVENTKNGIYDAECTKFQLYVASTKKCGSLAQRLSDTSNKQEIDNLLKEIQSKLEKRKTAPASHEYLQGVLNADRNTLTSIIRNFTVVNDESALEPIFAFLDATVSNHIAEAACKYGIGHAKELVEQLISQGEESTISASNFRKSFKAFIAKHDAAGVLHSLSEAPSDEVVQDILSSAPYFVVQLDIVNATIDVKTRAVSDFLKSSADQTEWAENGLIFDASAGEYEEALKARHQNLQGEIEISSANLSDERRGLLLYHRCCNIPSIPLEGRVVPDHFLTGSLNAIADRLEIGWHPKFAQLIGEMQLEDA